MTKTLFFPVTPLSEFITCVRSGESANIYIKYLQLHPSCCLAGDNDFGLQASRVSDPIVNNKLKYISITKNN